MKSSSIVVSSPIRWEAGHPPDGGTPRAYARRALAAAGMIGFLGNEIAAVIRHRAGKRLASPALVADGNHARVDGFVSLGVVVSAALVGLGYPRADPFVGMAITLVILKITWDSWWTIRNTEPGELIAQPREH